jgi:hypothetical protein
VQHRHRHGEGPARHSGDHHTGQEGDPRHDRPGKEPATAPPLTREDQEDRKDQLEAILEKERRRQVFIRAANTQDGKILVTWFLNECGMRATDPAAVHPELIALGNRLLVELGVIHETQDANLYAITEKLLEASNNDDLNALRKAAEK